MRQIDEAVTPDAVQGCIIEHLNSGVPFPVAVQDLAEWYASSLQTATNELVVAIDSFASRNCCTGGSSVSSGTNRNSSGSSSRATGTGSRARAGPAPRAARGRTCGAESHFLS